MARQDREGGEAIVVLVDGDTRVGLLVIAGGEMFSSTNSWVSQDSACQAAALALDIP